MARRRQVAKALAGVKPRTVLDYCTEKFGVHKGAFVAARIVQMAAVAAEHGRDFTNEQYIAYWNLSVRSGWLHRAEAQEVFGEEHWRDVIALLAAEMERLQARSPGKAIRLPLAV